jgi:glycosyltransferase involved in cell wall biosynthesis
VRALFGNLETRSEQGLHRAADGVTAICTDLYERGRQLGIAPERLLNLPNGVEINENQPVANRLEGRRSLGLPETGKLLVYAGEAPIDMDLVWDSFSEVLKQYPDTYLAVVGRTWQIPEIGPAIKRIIQLGKLPWNLYYRALASADVLLLPCRNTSRNRARWPGKLGFYMGAGRPIVANPTGDIATLLTQHPIGILTGETPKEFAEAIVSLLHDPALADTLGRNARALAESTYAWPLIASRLSAFYEQVLDTSRSRS